jgi:hypothetical protein
MELLRRMLDLRRVDQTTRTEQMWELRHHEAVGTEVLVERLKWLRMRMENGSKTAGSVT